MSRLIGTLAVSCFALTACGSPHASPPTTPTRTTALASAPLPAAVLPANTTTTPDCVGLSICTPPSPDAEGNPACFYSDGWQPNSAGSGIEVWYFHEPQNLSKPDKVTAIVRKKDGTNESQEAAIAAGQQTHRFEFPAIDKSSVQEVLLNTGNGRCFVIGPGS
jgi:hypothetical protein